MTILGLSGAIGSGKSFSQLKVALSWCNRKEKRLVTNFPLDLQPLKDYCRMKRYKYCMWLLDQDGGHFYIKDPSNLQDLLLPEAVVCLDEAGIFLNSREFAKTPKGLLADFAQSRKDGTDLIWAAQFNEQVDKQLRLLTQYWIHCDSFSSYDPKMRRPKLRWKRIYWMKAYDYNEWLNNPRDRTSHWKTRLAHSFDYEGGALNRADKRLFDAFNSFARLDSDTAEDKLAKHGLSLLPEYDRKTHSQSPSRFSGRGKKTKSTPMPLSYRLGIITTILAIFLAYLMPQILITRLKTAEQSDTIDLVLQAK